MLRYTRRVGRWAYTSSFFSSLALLCSLCRPTMYIQDLKNERGYASLVYPLLF